MGSAKAKILVQQGSRYADVVEGVEILAKRLGLASTRIRIEDAVIAVAEGLAEAYTRDGVKLGLEDLASIAEKVVANVWVLLEVYTDLRRRGRIVVPGPRNGTLLVKLRRRSPDYDYYVLVLEERKPIPLQTITSFIEEASKNGWTPLLAIVDAYGDVTYYMPSLFDPRRVKKGGSED